jgi:hypothetical protein
MKPYGTGRGFHFNSVLERLSNPDSKPTTIKEKNNKLTT